MKGVQAFAALISGLIFGFGLSLSGMLDPLRVRGFLDVFGKWNPSLIYVLGGAVAVAMVGVAIMRWLPRPVLDTAYHLPATTGIDRRLLGGSAIFGMGWGMAGLCPGPAVTSLTLGLPSVFVFVVAMLIGMATHDRLAMGRRDEDGGERGLRIRPPRRLSP